MDNAQPEKDIANLAALVDALPALEAARLRALFHISTSTGVVVPPPEMHDWIRGFFGSLEATLQQTIVKVTNLWTLEGALFNGLRAHRPMEAKVSGDLETEIRAKLKGPFATPLTGTPADSFGRVRGRHCITASNIAKYDGYHGVIVYDEPYPLTFDAEDVADYLDTALEWAHRAHAEDPAARYFFFMWNCLWKAGASILHGHAQTTMTRDLHYARVEAWRRAGVNYRLTHGRNYFQDLYEAHRSLGLTLEWGKTRVVSSLTPIKEKEVLLISETLDDDLKQGLYRVLRCYIDRLGVRSFNVALYLPPLAPAPEDWSGFPAILRIVDRGDPLNRTADIGAMELYAASVISNDPFRVVEALAVA
jgi:hypothetical protein